MKVLITGASSPLAHSIAENLSQDHSLRMMDRTAVDITGKAEFFKGDILNPDDSWRSVRGIDALIHTCEPPAVLPEDELKSEQMILDYATRGTHNIFSAAIAAGIKKFVFSGTLSIFSAYPDDVYISELWKPLPTSEINQMAKYLGEVTSREFARDYMVCVTCLRLGKLVLEEEVKGEPPNLMWLDIRDAAQAFRCALRKDNSHRVLWSNRWAIYHVCADIPNPKFLTDSAKQQLGYKPIHNFRD